MSTAVSQAITFHRVALSVPDRGDFQKRQQWIRQVKNTLEKVSLQTAMPPQAILVIRHLEDPKPGKLLVANQWQGIRAWEQAAQQALNDCWRTAVRPARSSVPASANSVWFVDRAEWLACLSWNVQRGHDHWWWKTVLQKQAHHSREETLFQLWQDHAQWLPATVSLLLQQPPAQVVPLLAALQSHQAEQLLEQILHIYQCSLPSHQPKYSPRILLRTYLADSVQAILPRLEPATQSLVAVCLTLPNTVQLIEREISQETAASTEITPPPSAPETTVVSETAAARPGNVQPITRLQSNPQKLPSRVPRIVAIESTPLTSKELSSNDKPLEDSHQPDEQMVASQIIDPEVQEPTEHQEFPLEPTEQGISTAVGGLWYLINILSPLAWPGQITPWHQLSTLAQALLPEPFPDPVWGYLAEIAGDPISQEILQQWCDQILPQVQDYLAGRLEHPIANYLLEPATLYLTRTHVDVIFTLDQIRLDVRMAGLDQDPGWVPALARVVAFHYE
ncbi:MAG: hypothetical protein AAF821_13560 [Cyanobacteria bacterium P01_D01_bin.156]